MSKTPENKTKRVDHFTDQLLVAQTLLGIAIDHDEVFPAENIPVDISHISSDEYVAMYMRQMASEPLLTAEEEVRLAKEIRAGKAAGEVLMQQQDTLSQDQIEKLVALIKVGKQARERFGRANTRLVVKIAKRYRKQGLPFADLIQEGNIGLMAAVDGYDYTHGNKFGAYAGKAIKQSITSALKRRVLMISLPEEAQAIVKKIHDAARVYKDTHGHKPTIDELAELVDMAPEKVSFYLKAGQISEPYDLDQETRTGLTLGDTIEDESTTNPESVLSGMTEDAFVEKVLNVLLSPREEKILRLRFGFGGSPPLTLEEVGLKFGLSRERIRQIEAAAFEKLRLPEARALLLDFRA